MYKTGTNNIKLDKRAIERLKQAMITIKAWAGPSLREVLIFGSYARGEQHKYSSIDILVIVSESEERFIRRKADLERALNENDMIPLIDPLVYTEEEVNDLKNKMESFVISVLKEGVVIWNGQNEIDIDCLEDGACIVKSRYSASLPDLEDIY